MIRFAAKAVLLVFVLFVALPSSEAAGPREETRSGRSSSTSLVSWSFFGDLWSLLVGSWSENGCELDPSGRCSPGLGMAKADNGCEFDPDGRCASRQGSATANNGCELDPNGRCSPGLGVAKADNGCEFDPNGGCRH